MIAIIGLLGTIGLVVGLRLVWKSFTCDRYVNPYEDNSTFSTPSARARTRLTLHIASWPSEVRISIEREWWSGDKDVRYHLQESLAYQYLDNWFDGGECKWSDMDGRMYTNARYQEKKAVSCKCPDEKKELKPEVGDTLRYSYVPSGGYSHTSLYTFVSYLDVDDKIYWLLRSQENGRIQVVEAEGNFYPRSTSNEWCITEKYSQKLATVKVRKTHR